MVAGWSWIELNGAAQWTIDAIGRGSCRSGGSRTRTEIEDLPNKNLYLSVLKVLKGRGTDTAFGSLQTQAFTRLGDAEDGLHAKPHTLLEGQRLVPLTDGDVRRNEVETADVVLVIDGNLLYSLNFNFFELPNGQLLDAIKGPAVGERENAQPCLKRGFVYRVFAVRR